ncbi:N-acetylmuramoyl-L-alanine amidase family protein [Pelodictyon luteolum]|uniref:N-acetylmuramoyl-L-alanine amidase n=1 Tax=Chlorobium luteolum (strain DSM 273 / BCRC 81028 / 2530) TaxID=319225 RepID=Q3B167_CHLL3|nr:N-acetylmuramoyl-L-alanine amidase [Pelodictyon luteolum]ABB24914.1 N-acetylmuramoyl-L-alanine amidase [Pelodictyon luteolum DSM 273]
MMPFSRPAVLHLLFALIIAACLPKQLSAATAPPWTVSSVPLRIMQGNGEGYTIKVLTRKGADGRILVDLQSMTRAMRLTYRTSAGMLSAEEAISSHGSVCTLTAGNSFARIVYRRAADPARIVQLSAAPQLLDQRLFLPISQSARIFSIWLDRDVIYSASEKMFKVWLQPRPLGRSEASIGTLSPTPPPPPPAFGPTRITGVDVEERANGAIISFSASGAQASAALSQPDASGRASFVLSGASGDPAILKKMFPSGLVRSVTADRTPAGALRFSVSFDGRSGVVRSLDYQRDQRNNRYLLYVRSDADVEAIRSREKLQRIASVISRDVEKWKLNTIVLDAGHGGQDPGAVGLKGTREKDVALNIVRDLGSIIARKWPDVEVVYTRKDDIFIPLHERGRIANRTEGKLFLSVHCNANENRSIRGPEVYILGPHKTAAALKVAMLENGVISQESDYREQYRNFSDEHLIMSSMAQNSFIRHSTTLARELVKPLDRSTSTNGRAVRQAGFMVLWTPSMPSALVEVGYISNPREEVILRDRQEQTKIAYGIFQGLQAYRTQYEASRMASAR